MFYFINFDNPSKSYNYDKGKLFETLCAKIIEGSGFKDIEMRQKKDNLEYDIVANSRITGQRLVGEAKAYDSKISGEILQFIGKMQIHWIENANTFGLFISTSQLTPDVKGQVDKLLNKLNFNYIVADKILDILATEADYCSIASIKSIAKEQTGMKTGETYLLVSDRGDFYIQLIMASEKTLPEYFCVLSHRGLMIEDLPFLTLVKERVDVLKELNIYVECLGDLPIQTKDVDNTHFLGVISGRGWFDYQFPAPPDKFIGRELIIKRFFEYLQQIREEHTSVRVYQVLSKSGVGKSSITLKLESLLRENNDCAIVVDSRNIRSEIDLLQVIQLVIEEINTQFSCEFDLPSEQRQIASSIKQINKYLVTNRKLAVIFFDQFESIFLRTKVYNLIIDLILELNSFGSNFVFGISRKNDQPTTYDESSEIDLNRLNQISIALLLKDFEIIEALDLIQKMNRELGRPLIKSLREQVLEISNGFPWLLKKFCAHIIKLVNGGQTQTHIFQSGMQLEDLFKEEIESLDEVLREFFNRLVYYLPATHSELTEIFLEDDLSYKLKALQNDYRLIRLTGRTYDTYNDVIKEYIKTGKIMLNKRYLLRLYPLQVINLFEEIVLKKWCSVEQVTSNKREAEGNIINKLRELRLLELIEGNNESFKPVDLALRAFEDGKLSDYLNTMLKQNGIVRLIIMELTKHKTLSLSNLSDLLKNEMPFIEAQDSTWLFYARVLGSWMSICNVASYRDGLVSILGHENPRNNHTDEFMPSIYLQQLEKFIELCAATNEPTSLQEIASNMGRKSINGVLSDAQFLDLIDFISRGTIKISSSGTGFVRMNKAEKKEYILNKLSQIPYIKEYTQAVNTGTPADLAFKKLIIELGVDGWSESTTEWRHKLLRNWLLYCGLVKRRRTTVK